MALVDSTLPAMPAPCKPPLYRALVCRTRTLTPPELPSSIAMFTSNPRVKMAMFDCVLAAGISAKGNVLWTVLYLTTSQQQQQQKQQQQQQQKQQQPGACTHAPTLAVDDASGSGGGRWHRPLGEISNKFMKELEQNFVREIHLAADELFTQSAELTDQEVCRIIDEDVIGGLVEGVDQFCHGARKDEGARSQAKSAENITMSGNERRRLRRDGRRRRKKRRGIGGSNSGDSCVVSSRSKRSRLGLTTTAAITTSSSQTNAEGGKQSGQRESQQSPGPARTSADLRTKGQSTSRSTRHNDGDIVLDRHGGIAAGRVTTSLSRRVRGRERDKSGRASSARQRPCNIGNKSKSRQRHRHRARAKSRPILTTKQTPKASSGGTKVIRGMTGVKFTSTDDNSNISNSCTVDDEDSSGVDEKKKEASRRHRSAAPALSIWSSLAQPRGALTTAVVVVSLVVAMPLPQGRRCTPFVAALCLPAAVRVTTWIIRIALGQRRTMIMTRRLVCVRCH